MGKTRETFVYFKDGGDALENYYQNTVDSFGASFQMNIKKGPNSTDFIMQTPEGACTSSIYDVLPYAHLIYYDIHAHSLPGGAGEMPAAGKPVQLNYCVDGKTELMLDDETYIYMGPNDLCLSCQQSQGDTYFPLKYYRGIALYLEDAFFSPENRGLLDLLIPDVNELNRRYLQKQNTFLGGADARAKSILEKLWGLYHNPEIFYKRLSVLELLNCLMEESGCREHTYVCYTRSQVEIAKKAEQILSEDLSAHIPVRLIAEQFGVSETSLKNYFRGVYGKNISAYLRDLRMTTAETALVSTDLSIAEIASRVGYTKQGKFAQVFKEVYHHSPLEYRRIKKLENIQ